MIDHALRLARRGLAVFPCKPRDKVPLTPHGVKDATRDPAIIADWWSRWPAANLAVATGEVSGIWILDVDGDDGEESLARLERQHGALPLTVQSITGKGRHIWFRLTELVGNSAGRLGDHLDTRGVGGYCIAPPSIHPSGRTYSWSVDHDPSEVRCAVAPDWLLALIRTRRETMKNAAPEDWRRLVSDGVGDGARNNAVARLAGHLLRRYVDSYVTLELLQTWNAVRCSPPLPADEVTRTVNSVARKELMRRAGGTDAAR